MAHLLKQFASKLSKCRIITITVSLDSLDDESFARLNGNRSHVKRVLEGIEAAAEAGIKVKVNMVVQKGNE